MGNSFFAFNVVLDGLLPKRIKSEAEAKWRMDFLRKNGHKQ